MAHSIFESITLTHFLALFGSFGWQEIVILLVIGVLIFGKRLPEVGRNFGKSIVEFKKGIKGIGDEIDNEAERPAQKEETTKPADLPPAKVTPDPADEADIKVEEAKQNPED
ncbi:MAG: twin-arginine translocase TatA/TatE family subunit [Phycisphaerales bacterium]|nr:twin-arginine translocase TatA/TatE family subunit [Phycisphaerales bacterium]